MTGYHEVRVFTFTRNDVNEWVLPVGWKPFAASCSPSGGVWSVVARKWHHHEREFLSSPEAAADMRRQLDRIPAHERWPDGAPT